MTHPPTHPASATASPGAQPQRRLSPEFPLWVLAILAMGLLLREASTICLWVTCSFLLFAILDPWMVRLGKRGISPAISSVVLIAFATGLGIAAFATVFHFSGQLGSAFDLYRKTLVHLYHTVSSSIGRQIHDLTAAAGSPAVVQQDLTQVQVVETSPLAGGVGATVAEGVGFAFTGLAFSALCPILTFFMIAERKKLASAFLRLFAQDDSLGGAIWGKIVAAIRAFFFGNLVLGAVSFPVFCVMFRLFHVQTPYVLAGAASLLNLIPFLGAFLSGLVPVLDLLSQSSANVGLAAALMGACLVLHFMVANLVTPKILGSKVDLNATTSTIALVMWGEVWGGFGLLLAIPITATNKILFEYSRSPHLHWIALLMSDDPESLLNQTQRRVLSKTDSLGKKLRFAKQG